MAEGGLLPYLGWFAFFGLAIIYGTYKLVIYLRAKCSKQPDPTLDAPLMAADEQDAEKGTSLNIQDELSAPTDSPWDAFKPSVFSSFLDIEDIINSSIFTAYFYLNTGYVLNSTVGHVQIALFSLEVVFQLIDLCVVLAWNYKLAPTAKSVSMYYRFKLIQINFNFLKILFKLFYSFDHLHQNVTFYSIVFSLTMVFRSLWMFIVDFILKLESSKQPSVASNKSSSKTERVKQFASDKAKYGLLQLAIVTPLFYLVNSIVLALEVMNSKLIMFIYCALWFLAPWFVFAAWKLQPWLNEMSTKCSQRCKCKLNCDEFSWAVTLVVGMGQCCLNTILFLIGIVGGVFVQISRVQFLSTASIYVVGAVAVLSYWARAKCKGSDDTGLVTCFCVIYALPFLVAAGFYLVTGPIFESDGSGEYDGTDENHDDYKPEYEPEYIPR